MPAGTDCTFMAGASEAPRAGANVATRAGARETLAAETEFFLAAGTDTAVTDGAGGGFTAGEDARTGVLAWEAAGLTPEAEDSPPEPPETGRLELREG